MTERSVLDLARGRGCRGAIRFSQSAAVTLAPQSLTLVTLCPCHCRLLLVPSLASQSTRSHPLARAAVIILCLRCCFSLTLCSRYCNFLF
ncbi:hypothetical protein TorRG33x02_343700 [Trema orientale]|uniref:Uncharacterized protein n=1 Tax=Trema orientale TaxID=63057 RepID=A0A2P5AR50_TREOI|nr:hypothetical protein TorRG33x02_343700 [Trema orientale]